jgi:YVTN family beta-propeller protein
MFPFRRVLGVFVLAVMAFPSVGWTQSSSYQHFEARQTHPIALSSDGQSLLALNSPAGSLLHYRVAESTPQPVLVNEIPVGMEPVSVKYRTPDEVWVVNELSDSISVVSLSQRAVIANIPCSDEPADVVFAAGKAFVSCARNNLIRVFNASTHGVAGSITLQGLVPRALAVNSNGTRVYAAFFHSGNRTTILPSSKAPDPPPATNPALPTPPKVGLIVPRTHSLIAYNVLDNDIAEIDTASNSVVQYFTNVGTNLEGLVVSPDDTKLYVTNTEALNLTRFEPALKGHFVDHRVSTLTLATGAVSHWDLHAGVDYSQLPNASSQATALAQPIGIVLNATGTEAWLAAFGSDRVAHVNLLTQTVAHRTDVRLAHHGLSTDTEDFRGPRALAWHAAWQRLYVLNKISDTLSVLDTQNGNVLTETRLGTMDPMPALVRSGRGYLYDARLSGNGTASCAICHPDADRDGIAWDLGDPNGSMLTVMGQNFAATHGVGAVPREMHPMKGPMVTQTLRGMQQGAPFHWRGDRPTLQSFGVTFRDLLAGAIPSTDDLDAMAAYLQSLRHHPNPNLRLNGSLPTSLNGGNPTIGMNLFKNHNNHCASCHPLPSGSDGNIDNPLEVGSVMPMKNASLQTTYQRVFFNPKSGQNSLSGYGMGHDGVFANLPTAHPYVLDQLGSLNVTDFANVAAFVMSFGTGTAPTVGLTRTISLTNRSDSSLSTDLNTLESQAAVPDVVDAVISGVVSGQRKQFRFQPSTGTYLADDGLTETNRANLLASLQSGDFLQFQGRLPGEKVRYGGDRDTNGVLNNAEPAPRLEIAHQQQELLLTFPTPRPDWYLEWSHELLGPWEPVFAVPNAAGETRLPLPATTKRFYRLKRTY